MMINVTLNDANIPYVDVRAHYRNIAGWATEHCQSYISYELIDVSDCSIEYDLLGRYTFADEKDAVMFKMKWS